MNHILFMFSLTIIAELFIETYFSNINHYMGYFLTLFMASLIDSVKAGCWLLKCSCYYHWHPPLFCFPNCRRPFC